MATHLIESPAIDEAIVEDHCHERRKYYTASQNETGHFPGYLTLSCPCVDTCHQEDNVERRSRVEDLKCEVPYRSRGWDPEKVEVARTEDHSIESLRYKRNT